MDTDTASVIAISILVFFSCIISASETAFISSSPLRISHLADTGNKRAAKVKKILENRKRFLSSVLIANNIVNISASAIATSLALRLFGDAGIGIATGAITLLLLVCGEITPKSIAREHPEQVAFHLVPFISFVMALCRPLLAITDGIVTFFKRLTGKDNQETKDGVTSDDIKALIDVGEEEGVLEQTERQLLHNILQFTDLTVNEIMTPRTAINAVESNATYQEIIEYSQETSNSRLPVYENDIDHIIGILYIKDFLFLTSPEQFSMKKYLRTPVFILENTTITDMQLILKKEKQNMAVIFDEYGGTAGIATLEDIVEEVFGPISDEYDTPESPEYIETTHDEYVIDGSMRLQSLEELIETPCESEYFDTVAGFFMEKKGEVPEAGARMYWNNWLFSVEQTEGHRITKIRVRKIPQEQL